jgi:hypothetical protein
MGQHETAHIRDRNLIDLITQLDEAIDVLDDIPLHDGLEFWEWDSLRNALINAANYFTELREHLHGAGAP